MHYALLIINYELSHPSYLMQEHKQDEQRTHEFHHKDEQVEEMIVTGSPVGDLVVYQLMLHIPADEQTSEESA